MKDGDSGFRESTLKAFLRPVFRMCLATSNIFLLVLYTGCKKQQNKNVFLPRTHDLLISRKTMQRHFFSLHPPSPFPCNSCTTTVLAFVSLLPHSSRFNFHCYTQREATPTQKSAHIGKGGAGGGMGGGLMTVLDPWTFGPRDNLWSMASPSSV